MRDLCVRAIVCEVVVQGIGSAGAPHSNAASDRASVGRHPLQQDDQHYETPQQTNPTTHVHRRGSLVRMFV